MRLLLRNIVPLREIIGLERAVASIQHNLGVALKQQRQRPSRGAYIDRLPKAVQHQHMLVEHRTHNQSNWRKTTQSFSECQTNDELGAPCISLLQPTLKGRSSHWGRYPAFRAE